MSLELGCVKDQNIDYLLKRAYFYPKDFVTGIATANGSPGAGPVTLSAGFFQSAVSPNLIEVGRNRYQAIQFSTVAGTLSATWTPYDMDNRWPVYVRYHWTSNTSAASVATFNTFFAQGGADLVTATPSTALTTGVVSTAKTTTPLTRTVTRWGLIGPLGTGGHAFECFPSTVDEVTFNFSVSSLTNGAIATDFVYINKIELAYTPRQTFGDGSGREAR